MSGDVLFEDVVDDGGGPLEREGDGVGSPAIFPATRGPLLSTV